MVAPPALLSRGISTVAVKETAILRKLVEPQRCSDWTPKRSLRTARLPLLDKISD